jgi:hypothetical protein
MCLYAETSFLHMVVDMSPSSWDISCMIGDKNKRCSAGATFRDDIAPAEHRFLLCATILYRRYIQQKGIDMLRWLVLVIFLTVLPTTTRAQAFTADTVRDLFYSRDYGNTYNSICWNERMRRKVGCTYFTVEGDQYLLIYESSQALELWYVPWFFGGDFELLWESGSWL